MLSEFAENFATKYFEMATSRSQVLLAATLPAYLVLHVMWEYCQLRGEERSVRNAWRKAFPIEDFRAVTFRTDLFCTFAAHLVKRPLLRMFFRLILTAVAAEVGLAILISIFGRPEVQMSWIVGIVALQTFALYVSDEFSVYVNHYLEHKFRLLWATHRLHHSAEALTPLTAASREVILPIPTDYVVIYTVDFTIKGLVLGAVLYWTTPTLHPVALLLMGYILVYVTLFEWFAHSRARISFGWLDRIFIAPVMHQLHHSAELRHRDKNFGRTLAIFDWMFGTLYIPAKDETWRLGLDASELGSANPHGRIREYLLEPYRYWWAALCGKPEPKPRRDPEPVAAVSAVVSTI